MPSLSLCCSPLALSSCSDFSFSLVLSLFFWTTTAKMVDPTTTTTSTDVDAAASRQQTASPTGKVAPLNPQDLEPLPLDGEDLEAVWPPALLSMLHG